MGAHYRNHVQFITFAEEDEGAGDHFGGREDPRGMPRGRGGRMGRGGPRDGRRGGPEDERGGPRGPRRAQRGAAAFGALLLLAERPMNGYELITEMEERSQGRWRPSPGSMYPTLGRLEDKGFVESEEVDGKRQYRLTDAGRERVASRDPDAPLPWDQGGHSRTGDLRPLAAELMGQIRQIGRFGTEAQREAADSILSKAKLDLYGVLATTEDHSAAEDSNESDESEDSAG